MLIVCIAPSAWAAKRVALVIGNGAYTNAPPLANPKNDAEDMAAALKALGFTVILGLDLDKRGMDRKILEFESALHGANAGVFHYSGHGLQVAGVNYLVPVDASLESAAALRIETVRLDFVQETMEREAKTNILFLDACRNNPLARNLARALGTRSAEIGKGLAVTEAGLGTLIGFSTQPGNVALDGAGRNSPFSGPLAKAILTPGKDLFSILIGVRNEVLAATGGKQVTWDHSALSAPFYFQPDAPAPDKGQSEAARVWAEIKDLKDVAVFEAFRKQYGPSNAYYDTLAGQKIAELKRAQVAVVTPPPPPVNECDGLLVSVAQSSARPCIKPGSGASFKDCPNCPEMVIAPPGSFMMGSPTDEPERDAREGPQHEVTIARPFAVGRFAVTRDEFDAFVRAGGHEQELDGGCFVWLFTKANEPRPVQRQDSSKSYRSPGFAQMGSHPVVCINWTDAQSYVKWLSRKTGRRYRLLSEAEFEYVARAGTTTPFWWGSTITPDQANYDGTADPYGGGGRNGEYRRKTMPVKSFQPNRWGLFQVHGNVGELVEDCWIENYNGAPVDGSARVTGDCEHRVVRNGAWNDGPSELRSAERHLSFPKFGDNQTGFRVARTLD